jgi:hypothetical protein
MLEEEEYLISIQDLQEKFQKWFGNPIPADPPFPAEADHSIGGSVPTAPPFPAETDHLNHRALRRRVDKLQILLKLFISGFGGAVSLGAGVSAIIFFMNISILGWYSDDWPNQIFVILFAAVLGFYGGVIKGFNNLMRKRYAYKGEL